MSFSKISLLEKAVDVTKAYASSGASTPLETVLKDVYEQLKKINEELE